MQDLPEKTIEKAFEAIEAEKRASRRFRAYNKLAARLERAADRLERRVENIPEYREALRYGEVPLRKPSSVADFMAADPGTCRLRLRQAERLEPFVAIFLEAACEASQRAADACRSSTGSYLRERDQRHEDDRAERHALNQLRRSRSLNHG